MNRTFAAVLLDLDGTLIDSTPVVVRSWQQWAAEHGFGEEHLAGSHGVPAKQIVAGLLPPERVDAAVARIEAIELADVEGIVPLPGAADLLDALPPGRAAVATSCTRPLAAARIAASGLRVPEVVVTASDVTRGKPDPEPFLLAASRLGVDPAACLVVEDAPAGLAAARAAGCATLAVTTTHAAGELDADLVVGSLAEVRAVLSADGVAVVRAG